MLAKCDDGCNKEFNLTGFKVEHVKKDIEKTYFTCPHCGKEYVAFYTDREIRAKQARVRTVEQAYNLACQKQDFVQAERLMGQVNKLHKEIKADMIKLRNVVNKA